MRCVGDDESDLDRKEKDTYTILILDCVLTLQGFIARRRLSKWSVAIDTPRTIFMALSCTEAYSTKP